MEPVTQHILDGTFILLAAACWGVMSKYLFHGSDTNKFGFWGRESHYRKYKRYQGTIKDEEGDVIDTDFTYVRLASPDTWYYKLFKLKYKEAFPGSATIFVAFTDGFHLAQWWMIKFILGAVTFDWRWYLIYWVIWTLTFTVIWTYLKWRK